MPPNIDTLFKISPETNHDGPIHTYDSSTVRQRAQFATSSRLLTCLVNEGLATGTFVPEPSQAALGFCLIRKDHVSYIVRLSGRPIGHSNPPSLATSILGRRDLSTVALLDPKDMTYPIYCVELNDDQIHLDSIQMELDPTTIFRRFAQVLSIEEPVLEELCRELNSSVEHMEYTLKNRKSAPTLSSSTMEWEQSIVEGHPHHPMHKSRYTVAPLAPISPSYDFYRIQIRFVSMPENELQMRGQYRELVAPLEHRLGVHLPEGHVLIPVHPLQIPNLVNLFSKRGLVVYPPEISASSNAQASLRTVVLDDCLEGLALKLACGMKVSSAMRTITPFTTFLGPGISNDIIPRLTLDHEALQVEPEVASVVVRDEDSDVAKHLSCILREETSDRVQNARGERIIPCAALVERDPDACGETISVLAKRWNLDTEAKRIKFLTRYVDLVLRAFLPPLIHNGFAFEAHLQNAKARFDLATGELLGFTVRDYGGIKVHQDTLYASIGRRMEVLEGSCVVAKTLDESFKLLHHTLIECHLHQIVRAVDLHYNGIGWRLVREKMTTLIPHDHPLFRAWLQSEFVPGKALMRMKLDGLYRDYLYTDFPNLILYLPPQEAAAVAREADGAPNQTLGFTRAMTF
ncbi:uncharacterized protein VTP21DRAFT_3582 [Calcarisporiella thermophila]|uniref:uncharacterized protein n=1 Tax=Calcarisporiella thermophila TaxID=911321 RepID=UPI00374457F1